MAPWAQKTLPPSMSLGATLMGVDMLKYLLLAVAVVGAGYSDTILVGACLAVVVLLALAVSHGSCDHV